MTRLRLLNVILVLALAGLACSLGSTGNTLPPTDPPDRPTAVRQPTDEDERPALAAGVAVLDRTRVDLYLRHQLPIDCW